VHYRVCVAEPATSRGRLAGAQPDRRQELLEVASDLFSRRGYKGTSLRQIADRMGFTVAALYYYFEAKSELLSLLAKPYLDELEAVIAAAEDEGPLDARKGRRALDRYLDLLLVNPKLTQFLEQDVAVQARPEGIRLDGLTERLKTSLAGPNPQPSDLVRASAALGALRRPVLRLGHLDLVALRDQILDQAVKLLYPRARPRAGGTQQRGSKP
jgi:AcrR family transcriptional regulator